MTAHEKVRLHRHQGITFCCGGKIPNQKQLMGKKEFILAYDSRGKVQNGRSGLTAGAWSRELREHIFTLGFTKPKDQIGMGQGFELSKNDA